jgi:glycosidase
MFYLYQNLLKDCSQQAEFFEGSRDPPVDALKIDRDHPPKAGKHALSRASKSEMSETTHPNSLNLPEPYFAFGFHLTKRAGGIFDTADLMPAGEPGAHWREPHSLRVLADRMNTRKTRQGDTLLVSAGQLIALGLLEDILRFVIQEYCVREAPGSLQEGVDWVGKQAGKKVPSQTLSAFVSLFPPVKVLLEGQSPAAYLKGASKDLPNRLEAAREVILLSLATANPATEPFRELFDDTELRETAPYLPFVDGLESFFALRQPVTRLGLTLFEALRAPMRACPHSLEGQIDYILQHWSGFLPEVYRRRALLGKDLLREEFIPRGHGPGPAPVLEFGKPKSDGLGHYQEFERFSLDEDWMSNVVMIAKTAYVWLDQLSKRYQRPIQSLDQVPDQELERLERWGFTALWLIGVWERSRASQRIKQACGNPEALASAYSLHDYIIAADLGGEEAYLRLRDRAWRFGIRLASDMVPNHMAIDSRWMIEHPDWFVQTGHPPFPTYSFNGPNLGDDPRVGIYLEDGYWDHRDAAVVFKRVDTWTGATRYIYHGNDGTHMPWNDTAQLNYLLPEVREAVIQTILHVARKFPIIRFDAAMTLAKRHYHRLWFPPPGHGGDIPSRAGQGLEVDEFNRKMPEEFWREVVDRVAAEIPNTLLLAEAFWLMEGYFVRTLGMHRVYNSAFMNMLKSEDNTNYRQTIKNVLEFSPEVLRRFVNFQNNPDEKTAVEQFGKGDKYFGVCLLMSTFPGLPMFGHGQVEGFAEKYGMEYSRAYWDEHPDAEFVRRHEEEIFPLLRKRYLFSGVQDFTFYDFHTPDGHVNEDVYAFSNRAGNERAIILYNNAYRTTTGWIRGSTAINAGKQDETQLVHRSLTEALGLKTDSATYYAFRDQRDGLEYLRQGKDLAKKGLFVHLPGYHYHAFLDFREIYDTDGSWADLAAKLEGRGTPDLDETYKELHLLSILDPFSAVLAPSLLANLLDSSDETETGKEVWDQFLLRLRQLKASCLLYGLPFEEESPMVSVMRKVIPVLQRLEETAALKGLSEKAEDALWGVIQEEFESKGPSKAQVILLIGAVLKQLEPVFISADEERRSWVEEWLLTLRIRRVLMDFGFHEPDAILHTALIHALIRQADLLEEDSPDPLPLRLAAALKDPFILNFLLANQYLGAWYVNKERLEMLLDWMFAARVVSLQTAGKISRPKLVRKLEAAIGIRQEILACADESSYQIGRMIEALSPQGEAARNSRDSR